MSRLRFTLVLTVGLACSSSKTDTAGPASSPGDLPGDAVKTAASETPQAGLEVAYFAGGCFWGVEHFLEQLDGVISVESGYMGGHVENPTYEQVSTKNTGHYETVRVRFDPSKVSFEEVAKLFFEIHDPTQADGQGPDLGPQYRSAVFYASPEQQTVTKALIERLKGKGYAVVTEVEPAAEFYAAEDYHQDYYVKTGKVPYCHGKVDRFGDS